MSCWSWPCDCLIGVFLEMDCLSPLERWLMSFRNDWKKSRHVSLHMTWSVFLKETKEEADSFPMSPSHFSQGPDASPGVLAKYLFLPQGLLLGLLTAALFPLRCCPVVVGEVVTMWMWSTLVCPLCSFKWSGATWMWLLLILHSVTEMTLKLFEYFVAIQTIKSSFKAQACCQCPLWLYSHRGHYFRHVHHLFIFPPHLCLFPTNLYRVHGSHCRIQQGQVIIKSHIR